MSSAPASAHDLATGTQLAGYLLRRPAVVGLALAAVFVAGARVVWLPRSWADTAVVVAIAVLVGPAEWFIHGVLFHAPPSSRRQRWLGTGVDHTKHHDDPAELQWLLLAPAGVAVFAVVLAAVGASVGAAVALALGSPVAGPALVAVALSWAALLHYEVTHLLIHSRCSIGSARYRRLRTNHLAHHHRNVDRRLGVTTTVGDRMFGTGPA